MAIIIERLRPFWGDPQISVACGLLMAMPFLAATAARLEVRYGMGVTPIRALLS
ncbi:MAG: hypothetical protein KGS00_13185 [Alphaproteobacteria bacterium]|nr:hypothetical protein [Alphaproteobacteria bacterium]